MTVAPVGKRTPKGPEPTLIDRQDAHVILAALHIPCGYFPEDRDEGGGWVRLAVLNHCRECDIVASALAFIRKRDCAPAPARETPGGTRP